MNTRPPLYRVITRFYFDDPSFESYVGRSSWVEPIGYCLEWMALNRRIYSMSGRFHEMWLEPI